MKTAVSSIVISFFSLAFFSAEATENREVPNDGRDALLVDRRKTTQPDKAALQIAWCACVCSPA